MLTARTCHGRYVENSNEQEVLKSIIEHTSVWSNFEPNLLLQLFAFVFELRASKVEKNRDFHVFCHF